MKFTKVTHFALGIIFVLAVFFSTIAYADSTTYPYQITDLSLKSVAGESLSAAPTNQSFIVNMDLRKTEQREEKDYLFVAVYDTNNVLLSINYVQAKFAENYDYSFGFNIPAQSAAIGSIRALVWNSFNSMTPLAEMKTLRSIDIVNTPEPEETPNATMEPQETTAPGNTVVRSATDFDYDNSNYHNQDYISAGKLYFYSDDITESFRINDDTELYVNGVQYAGDVNDGIDKFIVENDASDVTLVDGSYEYVDGYSEEPDGIYDLIYVNYYATAVVDSVYIDNKDAIITFYADNLAYDFSAAADDQSAIAIGSWDFDLDADDVTYTFEKDGSEVTAADLAEYDVLSIKYNVNEDFEDSNFYEVTVSSKQIEGKYSLYNSEDSEYTINGTVYRTTSLISCSDIESGVTYIFYLDVFDKIAYVDESVSAKKIAILDSAYIDGSGDGKVKLIFSDGTSDTVVAKDTTVNGKANIDLAKEIVFVNGTSGTKNAVQNRVVEYTINSSNELTIKENLSPYQTNGDDVDAEYKETSSKIGNVKFNEATAFIGYTSSDQEFTAINPNMLVDGNSYTAYGYSKMGSKNISRFVIIVDAFNNITATTRVAVYNKPLSTENDNGDSVYAYDLFVDGENVIINGEDDDDLAKYFAQGTAVMYTTNASGEITNFYPLTDIDFSDTDSVWSAFMTNSESLISTQKAYIESLKSSKYTPDLYLGAIVANSGKTFDIVNIKDCVSYEDDFENISYTDETNFYVVNYNKKSSGRISISNESALIKTLYSENDGDITWTTNPRFVLVKTLNAVAQDIIIYIPKT